MDFKLLHLIAAVIDACDHHRPGRGPGHPPTEAIRVVATPRRFLREGTPWRGPIATEDQASGPTLRRCLIRWAGTALPAQVHARPVGMLRGRPDLILDTRSVPAKRGGDLIGPNATDRAKRGTKYHIATDGDGVPVACAATAANVNDTLAFERLFLTALSWPGSRRCSPIKVTTPSATATCAAPSARSRASTGGGLGRAARSWGGGAGPPSEASPGCWRTGASPRATTG